MTARIIWMALLLGAIYFIVQGGEYSTMDIVRQRQALADLNRKVDSLRKTVDSLRVAERRVRTDAVTQERIAREEFGMVRGSNEILYRFIPDSEVVKRVQ